MKNWYLLSVALLALASCSQPNADAGVKNIAAAKQLFDAFNRHEWQRMAACYSDTAEFLDPSYGPQFVKKTPSETAAKYAELEKMMPDIHDEIIDITAAGDKVVVQFVSKGSAPGANGKTEAFILPICSVLTFKDGKIVKDATYYDNQ